MLTPTRSEFSKVGNMADPAREEWPITFRRILNLFEDTKIETFHIILRQLKRQPL